MINNQMFFRCGISKYLFYFDDLIYQNLHATNTQIIFNFVSKSILSYNRRVKTIVPCRYFKQTNDVNINNLGTKHNRQRAGVPQGR